MSTDADVDPGSGLGPDTDGDLRPGASSDGGSHSGRRIQDALGGAYGVHSRMRSMARVSAGVMLEPVRRSLARASASDVATALVALFVAVGVGSTLVGPSMALLGTVAGIAAAVVTVFLSSSRPVVRGVGGALAVPIALLVATPSTLALAFALGPERAGVFAAVALWSLVYTGFAATLLSWDRFGDGGVRRGGTGALLAAAGVVCVVVLRAIPSATVREQAGGAASSLTSHTHETVVLGEGSWAVVTFFALLGLAAFVLGRTLEYVPLERLLPPDRRGSFGARVDRTRRGLSVALRIGVVGLLVAVVAPMVVGRADGAGSESGSGTGAGEASTGTGTGTIPASPAWMEAEFGLPGAALATLVTTPVIRVLLLTLVVVSFIALLGEWIRRTRQRGSASTLPRLLAPVAGAALLTLALVSLLADPAVDAALESTLEGVLPSALGGLVASLPTVALVALVLAVATFSLSSTLLAVTWLRVVRVLPPRAGATALAACSVFVLAIGLTVVGRVESAILTAAAAFVVWDLGEYADSLRAELGRAASTRRAEFVHAGSSLLTGAVVAGGTIGLYRLVGTGSGVIDAQQAALAVAVGMTAVALVAWVLRG